MTTPNAPQNPLPAANGLEKYRRRVASQKRSDILSAARLLFAQQGFINTRMTEIAYTALVSTATLYTKFESKESLMQTILLECEEEDPAIADTFLAAALLTNPSFTTHPASAKTDIETRVNEILDRIRRKIEET
ncbi:MAG: TetR/AcrR family transcriptional regulator [Parvibaculaceae bacterium]|nr:TetR/AcrR family transcriptional regulator [Parvibaculaceae bacterium]